MADVNANIDININSSNALAQLKSLQKQIAQFHTSIAKSSESAALAQRGLQKNLLNSVNAISGFTAEMRTVKTSTESFTNSLEKNKFSMREYFRYAGASTKTFGRLFKSEFDTIGKVSEERVKRLQTQYIKMGRDTNGAMQAMAVMPTKLNMEDYTTKVQLAAQKQALFNQLMKQGSTNLLNFGKNTQWAGRQLMVGFTLPLMLVGSTAAKTFMEMEAQAIKFKKVYGDLFTPQEETQVALDNITELGKQFTRYGVAVSTTVGLAAEAAAAGFSGLDLQRQTTEATRLSILGQVDSQKALETTISLQNAFSMSSENLASSIDFLNAVENQTVVSLDDITTAIPKVAPVIQQLGGDVKDLAFFMAAMKEGGINASEGANALKSGLAALINPTGRAADMLKSYGINATEIVNKNKGDLKATVIEFASALNTLDPLARARAIEQMFGKFQFARLSTLFANVTKEGNQAARVLGLANSSVEDLATLSEKELGMTAESSMNKFKKTVEDLKVALIPVGQAFLEAATPIVEFVGNILEKFGNLSAGTKRVITLLTVGIGAIGPVLLMTFGLLANGVANIIKLFLTLRAGYQRLTGQSQILGEQTQYLTMEQIDAAAAAHSLNQTHATLTQTFTAEATAVQQLIAAYSSAATASQNFARANPGMMMPTGRRKKFAKGGVVPGSGNGDTVPAMLTPGEMVIPKGIAKENMGLLSSLMSGQVARRYAEGTLNVGGRAVQMQALNAKNLSSMQNIINSILSGASGLKDAEGVLAETLLRLSSDTKASAKKFVKELDVVAGEMERIQIPESIVGERDYSASGSGISQNVPTQLTATRGAAGAEEYRRAQVAAQATQKAYEEMGVSGQQLAQSIQVDRAHIVEVTQAEKRYREAWDTRLFIAQARAENEMSMLLMNEKNQKAYVSVLQNSGESEEMKRSILNKITKDIALTEDELQAQVRILEAMQKDTALMKTTTGQFGRVAVGTIAAGKARASMGPAGAGVGSRTSAETEMARQALLRSKFRGDTTFIRKLEGQGTAAIDSLIVAMEKRAQTKSPSKRTIKLAKDIMNGLVVGMKSEETRLQGQAQKVADIATLSKTSLYGTTGVVSPVQKSIRRQLDKQAKLGQVQQGMSVGSNAMAMVGSGPRDMNQRMDKLNRGFMATTFALSSLSGVASMAGGRLGKFSEILFQITGPMFALSSILQLFTGQKILNILKGIGTLKLGLISVGIAALAIGIKLTNDARKKELEYIYGLSNAMKTTTEQVKTLGDFFGVVPTKLPFEGRNREIVNRDTRSARDRLRGDESFQKQFAPTIKTLSTATAQQAQLAFTSLALNLKAQGFASEQVQTIIDALREEAGKTEVKLDVKSLDFSAESIKGLQDQITPLLQNLGKQVASGGIKQRTEQSLATGEIITYTEYTNDARKAVEELGTFISETSKSSAGMFRLGIISGDQFEASLSGTLSTLNGLDEATRRVALLNIFKQLDTNAIPFLKNLQTAKQEMMLIALLSSGVLGKDSPTLKALSSTDSKTRSRGLNSITRLYNNLFGAIAKVNEEDSKLNGGGATGGGKLNALQEKTKSIRDQTNAYLILRNANVDNATATELSNDAEIAAIIIANGKGKKLKDLIKLVNQYKAALKAQTAAAKENMSEEEKFKANVTRTLAIANLREKLIDLEYAGQIKAENDALRDQENALQSVNDKIDAITKAQIDPLNARIDANNFALEKISLQEDAINEKYDRQISALEKIETLNQDIANVQKQRLTIADAITRGDISAAASAMQDARAQQAESAVSGQRNALTASRDAAIAGLGRNALEKENKELQYQISVIENTQLLTLRQQKTTIEEQIEATQRNISAIELKVQGLKDAALYAGKTKNEIASQEELIQLADAAGVIYNETLIKQLANATGIKDAIEALNTEVTTIHTIITRRINDDGGDDGGYASTGPAAGGGPTGRGWMYGGMIPKYMAFGGRAVGSDTVPAMLTPGEFIVNKAAASAYGPMLKSLNESKYPSMLGSNISRNIPVSNNSASLNNNSTAVYNYSLGFNINGASSNANDIARAVMREIKNVDSQRIRGQRL